MARRLASTYGVPHVELDGFKLKPDHQLDDPDEFASGVRHVADHESWLLDGNWDDGTLADEIWQKAELVVWIDDLRRLVEVQLAQARSTDW